MNNSGIACTLAFLALGIVAASGCVEQSTPNDDAVGGSTGSDAACSADADCNDGDPCNGEETCVQGACLAGEAPRCGSRQACSPEDGKCRSCDADGDGHDSIACGGDDCDDEDGNRYPGNEEQCILANGKVDESTAEHDEDCDPATLGSDRDKDGYYDRACANPNAEGELVYGIDCDDTNDLRRPGFAEICDGLDNDCLNGLDYPGEDDDGDGYADCGDLAGKPALYDCNDNDAAYHPGAREICNGTDNNCNGVIDDGAAADENVPEWCDNIDNDCDGSVDEEMTCEVICSDDVTCTLGMEKCDTGGDCVSFEDDGTADSYMFCDGPEDCDGSACCFDDDSNTYRCQEECIGATVCKDDDECAGGQVCDPMLGPFFNMLVGECVDGCTSDSCLSWETCDPSGLCVETPM